jgi:hypothetical protein
MSFKARGSSKNFKFCGEKIISFSFVFILSAWIITSSFVRNVMILVKKFFAF